MHELNVVCFPRAALLRASPYGGMLGDKAGKGPRLNAEFASRALDRGPEPPLPLPYRQIAKS